VNVRSLLTAAASGVLLAASTAGAQVGYPPERSPYRDVEYRQELTLLSGYYAASTDPAGVAPQSGPMLGARYDVRIGGPASLTARVARVFSERNVINPALAPGARLVSRDAWPLYLSDVGITLALTGQKSLHHLVPVLSAGAGIASDFKKADIGGFRVGTAFALNFGGGVRWVPGGSFQLRADVTDHLYQISYPGVYFLETAAGANDAVLGDSQSRSVWKHNAAITVGASYLFFR
jgi:hypothetical protein